MCCVQGCYETEHGQESVLTERHALLFERVSAENPVTLCDLGVFADQAAEPVSPYNPDVCA